MSAIRRSVRPDQEESMIPHQLKKEPTKSPAETGNVTGGILGGDMRISIEAMNQVRAECMAGNLSKVQRRRHDRVARSGVAEHGSLSAC